MEYDFEEERIIEEIKERKAKRILLQLPEGVKKEGLRLSKLIESKTNSKLFISGGSCWGGCDLAVEEAKKINVDLLVHFGHAPFVNVKFPVLYIEMKAKVDLIPVLKKEIKKIEADKLALVGSVQYREQLGDVKGFLEDEGKKIIIPNKKGFSAFDGHVIGCEFSGLVKIGHKIEGCLVLGNKFHALGAALTLVDIPVYLFDEHTNKIELMDKEKDKILKQRAISLDRVRRITKIGILVDMKPGQYNLERAEGLKKNLEKIGKKVVIIIVKEFNPDTLMNFYDVKGFIDTACPRIAIDDYGRYDKPMINMREAQILLGKLSWNGLLEEGLVGF
ncbi:MAG: diphthamide biosynthesis enzyme Dph2 [Nanoarchaeota archaeon]|jgi:2-(3-amino-3-carboxypropyl)histidine synthase|nr:diphthamide biosynthesis enzyme Dph2 [Nanoarchaeota archaeon]|tara:strand:- start:12710 stop:13708 length:999 start_codon:yes stop_codon:yes gene_type:complete